MAGIEITKEFVDTFRTDMSEEDATYVLNELMMHNVDDIPFFLQYLDHLRDTQGDITRTVAVSDQPVSMKQFFEDDYFLGKVFTPFPGVAEMIAKTCNGGYVQWLGTGAIGIGKTTAAQVIICRGLYEMSCERFPQARYGLMPSSSIVIAMMNKNKDLAKRVTFGEFRQFIEQIPYFQNDFPFAKDIESELRFPCNIRVEYAAANNTSLLGKNVIAGILDEMNFQAKIERSKQAVDGGFYDQAATVYGQMVRRRWNRFQNKGRVPGVLCVVSSANYAGDFTDTLKKKVKEDNDGSTFIWDKPVWEVLPPERYCGKKFKLEIGDERYKSRVLKPGDVPREGAKVYDVPIELEKNANDDFDGFMRDDAGIVTTADKPFFYDKEKIWAMADKLSSKHLFSPMRLTESCTMDRGIPLLDEDFDQIPSPDTPRAIHIDLAVKGDACGFAMGYVDGIELVTRNVGGDRLIEELPSIVYDFFLQIKAPKGGEIEFANVRDFIYYLTQEGYPIRWISFDGFQSVDSRQILKRQGYESELISVEGRDSYEALRTAIWQGRIAAPEHSVCFNELAFLKEDREKQKVDHLPTKSKDVSDAMCGVYKNLMNRRTNWKQHLPTFQITDAKTKISRPVVGPTTEPILQERRDIKRRDIVRRDIIRRDIVRRDPVRR